MRWIVVTHASADDEIAALPVGLRARLIRLMEMIESVGLDQMREPHVSHVRGKIWELRAKAKEGIARGLYFSHSGRTAVVLHAFVKKSQKTPHGAIEIAEARLKEWLDEQAG
jgi:phage-related protein